jgi:hypothetical protein
MAAQEQQKAPQRFVVTPRDLGLHRETNYDGIERLIEILEGIYHR